MIHDRIRRARVLRGLTLEVLAQRLGDISKQGLSKFEKGESAPNSTRILQLSKALGVKPEYFFRTDAVELGPLEFRKLAKMPNYRQQQVAEQMREHLERYVALEGCFDVTDGLVQQLPPRSLPIKGIDEAEVAAQRLRDRLQIGNDAVANLTDLLEEHGIKVALLDGVADFDGACAATDDEKHVLIALNRNRPGERMRFTAAHELGHWVMAFPDGMSEADKETACHRFAGAFLYPSDKVLLDFGSHKRSRVYPVELLNAKRRYGVSMQLALRRLKDLHLLTDAGYSHAFIEFSRNGWRSAEPEPLRAEQPRRFESLVFRGLASDLFSPSRAAEFMQCRVDELDPALNRLPETA
ncbi:helix-turn-helix domain-containing protein [Rhodoferax fermentans]|uniref:Zinc peptidase n=1 Tax=Rhodoferax fermentans TaxID=28066 RepID=A0A1T1ASZ7_RHOFE|nr:XRE family transcriptional regulator [Rhodoferax fermentans]MBK1684229.1 zinc peptidase [Rhodoferax fermentans]OOV07095.1 zinc peptidase [Rhodoferax fermentans]